MKISKFKSTGLSASLTMAGLLLVPVTSQAAVISWGAAQNTSGPGDIVAGGAVVEARNGLAHVGYLADTPTLDATIGSITFDATNFLGQQFATEPAGAVLASKTSGDSEYDKLIGNVTVAESTVLGNGSTSDTNVNYQITGLTASTDYYVQVWYTDVKGGFDTRATTLDGSVTIQSGLNAPANDLGEFAIGTFTADGTTQLVNIVAVNAGRSQISGILVRAVPEPSSSLLLGLGGLAFLIRRRR